MFEELPAAVIVKSDQTPSESSPAEASADAVASSSQAEDLASDDIGDDTGNIFDFDDELSDGDFVADQTEADEVEEDSALGDEEDEVEVYKGWKAIQNICRGSNC